MDLDPHRFLSPGSGSGPGGKNGKMKKIHVLICGVVYFPLRVKRLLPGAWTSFMEIYGEINCNLLLKNFIFLDKFLKFLGYRNPGSSTRIRSGSALT